MLFHGSAPTGVGANKMSIKKFLHFSYGSVAVNDVFASGWDYEQTKVNFYQVVALAGKKTVVLCEVSANVISYPAASVADSECTTAALLKEEKRPVLDNFLGEKLTRQIIEDSGSPAIRIDNSETAHKIALDKTYSFSSWG